MILARKHLLVLAAFFSFSLMPVFSRGAGVPVLTMAAWRAIWVALIFLLCARTEVEDWGALRPDRKTLKMGALYGAVLALASSTFVGGYAFTTVANTIFLHNLAPVMAFPLAWWAFKEPARPAALTGAAVAVLGVAMLSGVSLFQVAHYANPRFLVGDFLSLLSALGYAGVLVMTRATRREGTPILLTLAVAWTVAALILTPMAMLSEGMSISGEAQLWLLGLAILCTNVPFYLLNLGMKEIGAGHAAVLSMSEVVFTTALGWAVFDEALSPLGWLGGGLVVMGVLYALRPDEEEAEEPELSAAIALPEEAQPWRWARLGTALLLFNAGAVISLLRGPGGATLLAWAGLASMLRLGLDPWAQTGGRGLRWVAGLVSALVLAALTARGGWAHGSGDALAAVLAVLALLADRTLAEREQAAGLPQREDASLQRLAWGFVALAELTRLVSHPAGDLLLLIAAAGLGLQTWAILLAAFRDELGRRPLRETGLLARWESWPRERMRPAPLFAGGALLFLSGGVHIVPVGHQGVVERFGRPLETIAEPGLTLRLPPPLEALSQVDVGRQHTLEIIRDSEALLCGDQSMIALNASMHYRVVDPLAYLYGGLDPEATLLALARAQLILRLSRTPHDQVLTSGRAALEQSLREGTQREAEALGLGLKVEAVHLGRVGVPAPVLASFLDVISAAEDRRRDINEAQAYAAQLIPRARGEAQALLLQAQAEELQLLAAAEAEALRFEGRLAEGQSQTEELRFRSRWESLDRVLGGRPLLITEPSIRLVLEGGRPATLPPSEGAP